MENTDFIYWLQGAFEMNPEMLEKGMSPQQVQTIQDHLNLVFNKVTPDRFENHVIDYNSSGNPPPQHPGSICSTADSVNGFPKVKKSLMRELRMRGSSLSTGDSGPKLFCETIDFGTKTAIEAGRNGKLC